jgi:hypothetical protein
MQEKLLKLLIAISEGNGEDAAARSRPRWARRLEHFDRADYTRDISQLVDDAP